MPNFKHHPVKSVKVEDRDPALVSLGFSEDQELRIGEALSELHSLYSEEAAIQDIIDDIMHMSDMTKEQRVVAAFYAGAMLYNTNLKD